MTTKSRSPGQVAISISLPWQLLDDIDDRANALGLKRSQYLSMLARQDLAAKGELVIREEGVTYGKPTRKKTKAVATSDHTSGSGPLEKRLKKLDQAD